MIRRNKKILWLTIILFLVLILSGTIHNVQAAITLISFKALPGDQQMLLEWETASEADMLGFYITRNNQLHGDYVRISSFIFTQGTSVSGLVYQYIDSNLTNGNTYFYKLEAIDNNYESEFFGPISAIPSQITATHTHTITGTVPLTTGTITPTRTSSATLNQTKVLTPSLSPTSPFSFNTNTPTITSSPTDRNSPTFTGTDTPDLTITPEITRTYKIISYNVFTPTITPEPVEIHPFQRGLVGFIISVSIGALAIILLIILQRKQTPD